MLTVQRSEEGIRVRMKSRDLRVDVACVMTSEAALDLAAQLFEVAAQGHIDGLENAMRIGPSAMSRALADNRRMAKIAQAMANGDLPPIGDVDHNCE
jgi:hypothetical protein